MSGAIFYRGPSLLTGDPIVGALTGLYGESNNPKTGPMVQAWILRDDRAPMQAVRDGADAAICGDCALRGNAGRQRRCYVTPWLGPNQVYKALPTYQTPDWPALSALLVGRSVRLGAYGDPAALPFEVWRTVLARATGHVGYTHSWRVCDPRLKALVMASVDTSTEFHAAHLAGWRTFRVRRSDEALIAFRSRPLEFVCPASDESDHRTTCERCQLCRGTSSPARSVAIMVHGKPSTLSAFGIQPASWFGRPVVSNN
jgi:hypothetical protein